MTKVESRPRITGRLQAKSANMGYEPLHLNVVQPGADRALRYELLERYHYLGYRVPAGAQLRYLVRSARTGEQVLPCLQCSSAAWRMAARDRSIGWRAAERARNLPFIVNDGRFLILPWARVKGPAGKILARYARQLPEALPLRFWTARAEPDWA